MLSGLFLLVRLLSSLLSSNRAACRQRESAPAAVSRLLICGPLACEGQQSAVPPDAQGLCRSESKGRIHIAGIPSSQASARERWLEARRKEHLPVRYVQVVFIRQCDAGWALPTMEPGLHWAWPNTAPDCQCAARGQLPDGRPSTQNLDFGFPQPGFCTGGQSRFLLY